MTFAFVKMLRMMPHIRRTCAFVKSHSARYWRVPKREQDGIVAVAAIIAIVLSFCAYRQTSQSLHLTRQAMSEQTKANNAALKLASTTLSLQAKDFRLRTRPICSNRHNPRNTGRWSSRHDHTGDGPELP